METLMDVSVVFNFMRGYAQIVFYFIIGITILIFLYMWSSYKDKVAIYQQIGNRPVFLRFDRGKVKKDSYLLFWSRSKCKIPNDINFIMAKGKRMAHLLKVGGDYVAWSPPSAIDGKVEVKSVNEDNRAWAARQAVETKDSIFSGFFEKYGPMIMVTLALCICLLMVIFTLKYVSDTVNNTQKVAEAIAQVGDRLANIASSGSGGPAP
jgi:hypothetical protein